MILLHGTVVQTAKESGDCRSGYIRNYLFFLFIINLSWFPYWSKRMIIVNLLFILFAALRTLPQHIHHLQSWE